MKRQILSLVTILLGLTAAWGATTVTPPSGTAVKHYYMTAYSYLSSTNPAYEINITTDGSDVYLQGLFQSMPEAWIKGTMDGRRMVFPSGQYLGKVDVTKLPEIPEEEKIEHATNDVYMFCSVDRKTQQPLVLDWDESGETFEAYYQYLFFSEANDMNFCFEFLQNMTGFSGSKNLVEAPSESFMLKTYRLQGINGDKGDEIHYNVKLGITDDDDVYIKGLCDAFPEAWVKGHLDKNGRVVFPRNQYLGHMDKYNADIWMTSANADEAYFCPFELKYSVEKQTFTGPTNLWLVFNGAPAGMHYYMILREVLLTPVNDEDNNTLFKKSEMPAGVPTVDFSVNVNDYGFEPALPVETYMVQWAQVKQDVYIKGIYGDIPEAVVHGVISRDGQTLTIPTPQYMGQWYNQFDCWMKNYEGDGGDILLTWNAASQSWKLPFGSFIVMDTEAADITEMPLCIFGDMVLTCQAEGVNRLTATTKPSFGCYDLQGRQLRDQSHASGVFISNGKLLLK